MILRDGVGHFLENDGLARLGGRGNQRPLALPERRNQVDDSRGERPITSFELEPLLGIERREVVEEDFVLGIFWSFKIDRFDFEQSKVALTLLGRTNLSFHRVPGSQIEALDLRGRDIDIVRASLVVLVRGAHKAEPVLENLQHAFGKDPGLSFALRTQDGEEQILLGQDTHIGEIQILGVGDQFGQGHGFEAANVNALGLFVVDHAGFVPGQLRIRGQVVRLLFPGLTSGSAATRRTGAPAATATRAAARLGAALSRLVVASLLGHWLGLSRVGI